MSVERRLGGVQHRVQYLHMTDEHPDPVLGEFLDHWRAARAETDRHLAPERAMPARDWAQRLADLLARERAWQEQYTRLLGFGSGGDFPESR